MTFEDAFKELQKINSSASLPKAIKSHCNALQSTLDSTTDLLYTYLKPGLLQHLNENIFYASKEETVLCGILNPSISITADDVAPHYSVQVRVLWHLNLVTISKDLWDKGKKHISPLLVFSNDPFSAILHEPISWGLDLTTNIPDPEKCKLILQYIEKQNMIERFSIIKSDT